MLKKQVGAGDTKAQLARERTTQRLDSLGLARQAKTAKDTKAKKAQFRPRGPKSRFT